MTLDLISLKVSCQLCALNVADEESSSVSQSTGESSWQQCLFSVCSSHELSR